MIEIKYYQHKNRYAISTKGHAGYAPLGEDIVCAAVSSAIIELGNYILEHFADEDWIVLEVNMTEGEANIEILDESNSNIALHIYQMTMEHLIDISESYPLHVKVFDV